MVDIVSDDVLLVGDEVALLEVVDVDDDTEDAESVDVVVLDVLFGVVDVLVLVVTD